MKLILVLRGFSLVVLFLLAAYTSAQCDYPSDFRSGTWKDSVMGDLTFGTNSMNGWSFFTYGKTINSWNCLLIEGTTVVSQSQTTFSIFGLEFYAYLCMETTRMTQYSYYYYSNSAVQPNAEYRRVTIKPTNETSLVKTASFVCTDTPNDTPNAAEFHVLIRRGFESLARTTCPPPLFGTFHYTHKMPPTANTETCNSGTEVWDVCVDRMNMTFDYNMCPTPIAYSAGGHTSCVAWFSQGPLYYLMVYNYDAPLSFGSYQFTCMVITRDGTTGTVYATQSPSQCQISQTSTTVDNVGAILTLIPYVLCPLTTSAPLTTDVYGRTNGPDTSDAGFPYALIIGSSVGGFLLFATAFGIAGYCIAKKKNKRQKIEDEESEDEENGDGDDDHIPADGTEPPSSEYVVPGTPDNSNVYENVDPKQETTEPKAGGAGTAKPEVEASPPQQPAVVAAVH